MNNVEVHRRRFVALNHSGFQRWGARAGGRTGVQHRHGSYQHNRVARCVLAALFCVAIAGSARAETVNQRAENEARSYLTPCKEKARLQDLCIQNQRNFIEEYVRGKAGDGLAMGSTASSFTPVWEGADPKSLESLRLGHLGVPSNRIEACAWRLLRFNRDPNPTMEYLNRQVAREALLALPDFGQALCLDRAEALDADLRVHPVRMPSDEWSPAMPGDRPAKRGARPDKEREDLITIVPDD